MKSFYREVFRPDRAVIYAVSTRLWQFLAGGVSLWIVAKYLTPETQGFYYAFSSLLAIQTFFDMGLTGVLIYVASHEWSAADDPQHSGYVVARRRLRDLLIRSRRWFALCAIAFAAAAGAIGFQFFRTSVTSGVDWLTPWFAAVGLTGLSLWYAPSIGILEGCNRMATVNAYRFGQAIVGNLLVWTTILLGGDLWAVAASAAVRLAFDATLVHFRFGPFFADLLDLADSAEPQFSWKTELLPLQWRIAVQSVAGYLAIGLYTPIIFKYHGPVVGGRMGMTWNVISIIQMTAFVWIQTRIPEIGRLISERRIAESRSVFRSLLLLSTAIYVLGCGALFALILLASQFAPDVAARLLPLETVALFCLGAGFSHAAVGLGTYVRAMKIDPFLKVGVATAVLMGSLVWVLGARYGPVGVAAAHIGVIGAIGLPVHWFIYRKAEAQQ